MILIRTFINLFIPYGCSADITTFTNQNVTIPK